MKQKSLMSYGVSLLMSAAAMSVTVPASAQQINGVPGSPSATTTIDGNKSRPPIQNSAE